MQVPQGHAPDSRRHLHPRGRQTATAIGVFYISAPAYYAAVHDRAAALESAGARVLSEPGMLLKATLIRDEQETTPPASRYYRPSTHPPGTARTACSPNPRTLTRTTRTLSHLSAPNRLSEALRATRVTADATPAA